MPTASHLDPAVRPPVIARTCGHIVAPDPDITVADIAIVSGCPHITRSRDDLLVNRSWWRYVDIDVDRRLD